MSVSTPLPALPDFFLDSGRTAERLSPDGERIAFLEADSSDRLQLWMIRSDASGHPERISQNNGVSVAALFWINHDTLLWQTADQSNRPRFFLRRLNGSEVQELFPDAKSNTALAGVVPRAQPGVLATISAQPEAFPDLFRLPLHERTLPQLVWRNQERISDWAWNAAGEPVAGLRWTESGAKEVLKLDGHEAKVIVRSSESDDARLLFTSGDGTQLFLLTNLDSDLTQVQRLNLQTGTTSVIAADPHGKVDVDQVVMDSSGRNLLAVAYTDSPTRWQSFSTSFTGLLESASREKINVTQCVGVDENQRRWLVRSDSDREPGIVYLYDRPLDRWRELWHDRPDLDRGSLCPTVYFEFMAKDGVQIPGYLTTPRDAPPPWPMVAFPHGGPRMRTRPGFDGRVQFLASRGYAVFQPNFRGSRGYGKAFMNAGDGQWGLGRMQTDVTDGVEELIRIGKADPKRIAIMGGSYGGYAALAGATFTPDLYAVVISLFGISDLNDYAAHTPLEWAAYSGDTRRRLGGAGASSLRTFLSDRSPANHLDRIKIPLLLYHGAKDPLVPVRHAEKVVRGRRSCVEFLLANDESHGFSNSETEMAVYRAIELFLHKHLGGQVGPSISGQIENRLTELRRAGNAVRTAE